MAWHEAYLARRTGTVPASHAAPRSTRSHCERVTEHYLASSSISLNSLLPYHDDLLHRHEVASYLPAAPASGLPRVSSRIYLLALRAGMGHYLANSSISLSSLLPYHDDLLRRHEVASYQPAAPASGSPRVSNRIYLLALRAGIWELHSPCDTSTTL